MNGPGVQMRLVERLGSLPREQRRPGDARWAVSDEAGREVSLLFCCPCGCGDLAAVSVFDDGFGKFWSWDGDRNKPTLDPSIQKTTGCQWHGWLRGGFFVPC